LLSGYCQALFRGGFLLIGFCMCSSLRDDYSFKGRYVSTPSSMGNEDYKFSPFHMSWSMPLPYSSPFYQNQPVVNESRSTKQRVSGTMLTETLPITSSVSPQLSGIKRAHYSGHIPELPTKNDVSSQLDFWGVSPGCPLAGSTLTEDDFLDMVLGIFLSSSNKLFFILSILFLIVG